VDDVMPLEQNDCGYQECIIKCQRCTHPFPLFRDEPECNERQRNMHARKSDKIVKIDLIIATLRKQKIRLRDQSSLNSRRLQILWKMIEVIIANVEWANAGP